MRWIETDKGDPRCRELADRHYTRKKHGDPRWTRPGYSQVLFAEQRSGRRAVFVWWRPKWEDGRPGTQRFDGLRCIENTIFRNETRFRSSDLIDDAIACLLSWKRAKDVEWPDGIITGVNSEKTAGGRADDHDPGWCFIKAGFEPFDHPGKRKAADVWLRYAGAMPALATPARSERLIALRSRPLRAA
jgi:hypothetical protein